MLDLALHDTGEYIPVKDISERQDITVKYMEYIITQLSRAGLLKSVRGNGGGYKLARPPEQYTAGEILRTIEGSLAPVACLEGDVNTCPRCAGCLTLPFWEGLNKTVNDYVDGVTLEDLLHNARGADALDYMI